jgi:hypothetical protein
MHIAGLSLSSASGQSLDQQRCFAPVPGDDTIGSCTALIPSGQETPENLAKAFSIHSSSVKSNRMIHLRPS